MRIAWRIIPSRHKKPEASSQQECLRPSRRSPLASGKPLYDLLGTPAPDSVLTLYGTDHFISRKDLIQESLAWLDAYLGPVER